MWVLITRYGYIGVTNLQLVAVNLHWCYNSLQEYGKEEKNPDNIDESLCHIRGTFTFIYWILSLPK